MEKKKTHVSQKFVNDSFLKFVASVTTFMQNCNNVELSKNLSMYIAFYMWKYVDSPHGISLGLYNSFVNDVSVEYQKFGVSSEYDMCEFVWKI